MSKGIAIPRDKAIPVVQRLIDVLTTPSLTTEDGLIRGEDFEIAGSFRRGCACVHDLDLVVACEAYSPVVLTLLNAGLEPIRLKKDGSVAGFIWQLEDVPLRIELYRAKPGCWGAEVLYATGSGRFNIEQRARAKRMGFKLSNYGLFSDGKIIAGETEWEIFATLGEPYLSPEERDLS